MKFSTRKNNRLNRDFFANFNLTFAIENSTILVKKQVREFVRFFLNYSNLTVYLAGWNTNSHNCFVVIIRIGITILIQWMQEMIHYRTSTNWHELWWSGWLNFNLFLSRKMGLVSASPIRATLKKIELSFFWCSIPSVPITRKG